MRIVVFGANGRTGRQIVAQALAAGHEVTAFVRDPAKAPGPHPRLRVAVGEVTCDQEAVAAAVTGQDAVLSALGSPSTWSGLLHPTLTVEAAPVIVRAMRGAGVRRLVFLSAHGVGETRDEGPASFRLMYRFLGPVFGDKAAGERVLRDDALDWTLVYPVMLVGARRTGTYRAGEKLPLSGLLRISRGDVADFMLRETEERAYVRKVVELAR
jgi:putative NADH-flavin reductase